MLRAHVRGCLVLILLVACGGPTPVAAPRSSEPAPVTPIPLAQARAELATAQALCTADHGALWQVPLCGPIMMVDRATRFIVANQADAGGLLTPRDGVFVGSLPASENIANTSLTWSGVHWVQLVWPLPDDPAARQITMVHEMFHRIAAQVGIAKQGELANAQLATADGRYYLQLEWRALAAALRATDDATRRRAIADVLGFRAARRARFPGSAAAEDALELHEGLAEYTGVVVGQPAAPVAAALRDLTAHVDDPSFMASFAYATGPALGLLLDRYAPPWRAQIRQLRSLSDTLAHAVGVAPSDPAIAAAGYDGAALRRAEDTRAAELAAQLARYQRVLVDGPVATLGFRAMSIQYDPRNVQPLGELGSVYPTLRVSDAWGVLTVTHGALVTSSWQAVVVPAPSEPTARPVTGDGWTLELAPGWSLVPDARRGDFRLARAGE